MDNETANITAFKDRPVSPFFWLWVPVIIMLCQAAIEIFVPMQYKPALHSESGPHEFIEFLFIGAAFIVALRTLPLLKGQPKWLYAWLILATICCFYVAGEEISWGQHLLKWSTPEYWAQLNDQHETNLHNTSSWFDQKPRLLLLIGVLTGGFIFPALQKFKPGALPAKFAIIYPPAILAPTAFFVLAVKVIDKIDEYTPLVLLSRDSEVEELYLFYFVLLYMVILRRRLAQQKG